MFHLLAALALSGPLPVPSKVLPVMGAQKAEDSQLVAGPCAAGTFAELVGQPADAADAIPEPKRILPPGAKMTMEFREERTNIYVDESGTIDRLTCG